jgi:tripeptide aminopeptidase
LIAADGLNQMKLGKVDETTVANVGVIRGGHLASVIPDTVEMTGEVRSFTQEGLETQINYMIDAVQQAADRRGGKAHADVEKKYLGWELTTESEHVQVAVRAAKRIGVAPYFTDTLGGADTNIFNEHGLTCFTLGLGFRDIHSFEENISIENLTNTARYVVGLVEVFAETYGS